MFIADQWLRDHPDEKKVADTTLFFDPLFREHGYTFEDYDRSVSYYVARPDRFSDITTRVADELKRMYAEMQEEEGRRDEGDSVYEVVDFRARLKERRKATARVILLRAVVITAALAAVAALVWLLFFSPVFRLETGGIQVSGGNEWVSEEQIMQIAGKQTGKSLLLVSSDDVIDQLDDIPGVTEAKVSKQFPNRLRVTVRAQRPAAMLRASDGSMTAVDSKGRVLNSVGNVSVEGIPVVDVGDVDQGLSDQAVHETLSILGRLDESIRQRISSVSAQTQDSITTVLDGGNYTIVWGDSSDLKLKKAVVDKIINDPNVIGDKHQVDVSAPLRPIIK